MPVVACCCQELDSNSQEEPRPKTLHNSLSGYPLFVRTKIIQCVVGLREFINEDISKKKQTNKKVKAHKSYKNNLFSRYFNHFRLASIKTIQYISRLEYFSLCKRHTKTVCYF